jgi:signal transduction histidine kinase
MKVPPKEQWLSSAAVLALIAILAALGVVQYRWSREVSTATGARMLANLHFSMMGMRDDLGRELSGLSSSLQSEWEFPDEARESAAYAQRIEAWKRTANHPALLANLFLYRQVDSRQSQLLRLNTASGVFEPAAWPDSFSHLQDRLRAASAEMNSQHVPWDRGIRGPAGPPGPPNLSSPWQIEESIPALIHLEIKPGAANGRRDSPETDWIIAELDAKAIREQILPELSQRYFAGQDGLTYDVAVLAPGDANGVLYSTSSQLSSGSAMADARLNLFGPPFGTQPPHFLHGQFDHALDSGLPMHAMDSSDDRRKPTEHAPGEGEMQRMGFGSVRLQPLRYTANDRDWELIVRHHKGSLEEALTAMRRRHLAISFGVLLVLAMTMAMILHASRRAQRLAALQMEFVAGVSHELRTPLAVISSAAENLADGIVEDKTKLKRYGTVIGEQTRQLTRLVEQILLFAATRQHRRQYNLARVRPQDIVEAALARSAELIRQGEITVAWKPAVDLPAVLVDLPAITDCLQNLIANAVKYGGEARWLGIRVDAVQAHGRREIQFQIEDRGIGIASADLRHIFDPFYRSPAVRSAQIHGTGLGLSLAKNIAEAMGGRLSVSSKLGIGSSFRLNLPYADDSPARATAAASEVSTA